MALYEYVLHVLERDLLAQDKNSKLLMNKSETYK